MILPKLDQLPEDKFDRAFWSAIDATNLNPTQIAHLWSIELDRSQGAIRAQLSRWRSGGLPANIRSAIALLDCLGYEVVIKRKSK